MKRYSSAGVLALFLVLLLLPVVVFASGGATAIDFKGGSCTISADGAYTAAGDSGGKTITVESGVDAQLSISGLTIDSESGPAIYVEAGATLELIVNGENTLSGSAGFAGICVEPAYDDSWNYDAYASAKLYISGSGTLSVNGGDGDPNDAFGGGLDDDLFIIYAHNMKNGTMFGELDRYRQQEFRDENPGFTLTTAEGTRSYEIFAAVETRVLYENEQGLRWYGMAGSLDAAGRAELIDWLLASSLYDCGIRPGDGEQLVLLCTCSYHEANGRFLVAARRVA